MGLVLLDKVVGEGKVLHSRMVVSRMYLNMMRRERGGHKMIRIILMKAKK